MMIIPQKEKIDWLIERFHFLKDERYIHFIEKFESSIYTLVLTKMDILYDSTEYIIISTNRTFS